jgi:hypothetical protein
MLTKYLDNDGAGVDWDGSTDHNSLGSILEARKEPRNTGSSRHVVSSSGRSPSRRVREEKDKSMGS